jgi:homogentisate 1,2-dioxygenase
MIHYARCGVLSPRAHAELRLDGQLLAEHVFTREGFDGQYSILYQRRAPTHETGFQNIELDSGFRPASVNAGLKNETPSRQLFRSAGLPFSRRSGYLANRQILLHNADCTVSLCHTESADEQFFQNGDADEIIFVAEGGGTLETIFGRLPYRQHDYVIVPRGVPYRLCFSSASSRHRLLVVEAFRGFRIPRLFLNEFGQLRLDAPYNERDFRIPQELLVGTDYCPELIVCRNRSMSLHTYTEWPYQVVGWDGHVYPFAFNVHDYKPKTSTYHLPPTAHCVFEARGFVMMNFVPRLVDYGKGAIPCPYPHSSIDCDEVLYYADGDFTSRKGVEQYDLSFHPAGIPHGPHPEKYEQSIGSQRTEELAIMVDTFAPLSVAKEGQSLSEPQYHMSWNTKEHL